MCVVLSLVVFPLGKFRLQVKTTGVIHAQYNFYNNLISSYFTDVDDEDFITPAGEFIRALIKTGLEGSRIFFLIFNLFYFFTHYKRFHDS